MTAASFASAGAWVAAQVSAQGDNLDPVPEPADVNAGLIGALVLLGLVVAVVILVIAMNRQLKTVNRRASEGAYDDLPTRRPRTGDAPHDDDPRDEEPRVI